MRTVIAVPGIYDASTVDYDAINAINQSTLKAIAKSPLHYKHRLETSSPGTVPMRLGGVAHCAVLEPHMLPRRYAVWAPVDAKTGKPKKDDFKGNDYLAFATGATLEGKTVIKQRELDAALRMSTAIRSSQLARRYFAKYRAEVVLVWIDKKTGLPCKCRLDMLSELEGGTLVVCELKTAADVSEWGFSGQYAKLGYDIQAAFYHDAVEAVLGSVGGDKCIAVENTEPHDVVVYDLNEVIDVGRELYQELLGKVVECRSSGLWLGQSPTSERTLRLPKWRDPSLADESALDELGLYGDGAAAEAP